LSKTVHAILVLVFVLLALSWFPPSAAYEHVQASIPSFEWKFLSPSEKAAVDASVDGLRNQRTKNVTLAIVNGTGDPYTGTLRVTQNFTDFVFSAAGPANESDEGWRDFLAINPSLTQHVYAAWWNQVEATKGVFTFNDADWGYQRAIKHGMTSFHLFIGPSLAECCNTIPAWAKALEYDSLKGAMQEYVNMTVTHFKGRVEFYEIWWEANANYGNGNWPLVRIIDIIKMEASTIRSVDPTAKICVDLDNISTDNPKLQESSTWSTEYFVQQMLAARVPFDVIGLEMHYGTGPSGRAGDIATLYGRLVTLSSFGKPLYVWEDGLESYIPPNSLPEWLRQNNGWVGPWHGDPSEEKQAEFMVAETLVYLGNPLVVGVYWLFMVDDPSYSPWSQYEGLIYTNGTKKESFYALRNLWGNLTTDTTIQSIKGVATFTGLAGEYTLSVEGYEVEPSVVRVSEEKSNTFSLVLRSLALRSQASQMLASVGSNLTAPGGEAFQSAEAGSLLDQSLAEYRVAEQLFQSKNYTGVLQHARKALDLIQQAQLKEKEHQQQQQQLQQQILATRIAEIVVAVAVPVVAAGALVYYLGKRKRSNSH
jgi:hypothetical protein